MNITEEMIKAIASPLIYKRGAEYYREGRVHIRSIDESTVKAVADDNEVYNISVSMKEDKITEYFCTCRYYHTMGCTCKHIVAALKLCRKEISKSGESDNDNDTMAEALCHEYEMLRKEKTKINMGFRLNIYTGLDRCGFSLSAKAGIDRMEPITSMSAFISSLMNEDTVNLSKHVKPRLEECAFGENEWKILNILGEILENRQSDNTVREELYVGEQSIKHILPYLRQTECEYRVDGISYPDLRMIEDDPDILVDVSAQNGRINMTVNERGAALTKSGSHFLYEGDIYFTSDEWRKWFMPIYRAVIAARRTQIEFSSANAVSFVMNVLPELRGRRGVVLNGFDKMVVDTRPEFEVFLDKQRAQLAAVIKVHYGSITVSPEGGTNAGGKILVRNTRLEREVMDFFAGFSKVGEKYIADDDDVIFDFINERLEKLKTYASVKCGNVFKVEQKPPLRLKAGYLRDVNLFELGFESELSTDEVMNILYAASAKREYYRADNGVFYKLNFDGVSVPDLINSLEFDERDIKNRKKTVSAYNAFYLSGLKDAGIIDAGEGFDEFIEEIRGIKPKIPPEIDAVLRDYQREGVCWLNQLAVCGFGGILADDMGLGKTLQVIAFAMSVKRTEPVLVVAPSSLTYNWQNEIIKFAPNAKSVIIEGAKAERIARLDEIDGYDFVITSYPLMRRDMELYKKKSFSYFFIDEAQYIKNPGTINAKSVKKIKAGGYFALTGTPVENTLSELWSVFDFVMKGYLYSAREFNSRFSNSIMKDGDRGRIDELRRRIRPFILRRMKKDVLGELPEKIENTVFAAPEPEQKRMYEAFLRAARNEISYMSDMGGENRMRVLGLIMRLRQICCHPKLFKEDYKEDSGKLLLLEELATSAIDAGHRILVFSQFTSMLTIIKERLDKLGITYFYLDGQTHSEERTEMAEKFNKGERDVFLISLKAGGVGLNLVGADMVIHYDPWWNPAVMDQASDRAYRIGQTRAVQVIKLAMKGTIEEQIIKLQDKKRELAEDIIRENSQTLSGLTKEEILEIFFDGQNA